MNRVKDLAAFVVGGFLAFVCGAIVGAADGKQCQQNGCHWDLNEAVAWEKSTGRRVTWRCEARPGTGFFWTPHIKPAKCDAKSPRLSSGTLATAYREFGREVRFRCEDGVYWMVEE